MVIYSSDCFCAWQASGADCVTQLTRILPLTSIPKMLVRGSLLKTMSFITGQTRQPWTLPLLTF